MRFWWASQNKTYKDERSGGYLWAPKHNENGQSFFHWQNVARVEPGDVIFSYFGQRILAISTAASQAYDAPLPRDWEERHPWFEDGWKVDVVYDDLEIPIQVNDHFDELRSRLPDKYSPLATKGGAQGYLFSVPEKPAEYLLELAGWVGLDHTPEFLSGGEGINRSGATKVRIGQSLFRKRLKDYWGERCAVTGASTIELLRASHTIGWSEANPADRVDVFNGFLLAPAYDAAFDANLISFDNDGKLVASPKVDAKEFQSLGIDLGAQLRKIEPSHLRFLDVHRSKTLNAK